MSFSSCPSCGSALGLGFAPAPQTCSPRGVTLQRPEGTPARVTTRTSPEDAELLSFSPDDTFAFWRGLKDTGLLEDIIQEFQQELLETMKGLQQRAQEPPLQLGGEEPCMDARSRLGRGDWGVFSSLEISGWHIVDNASVPLLAAPGHGRGHFGWPQFSSSLCLELPICWLWPNTWLES